MGSRKSMLHFLQGVRTTVNCKWDQFHTDACWNIPRISLFSECEHKHEERDENMF